MELYEELKALIEAGFSVTFEREIIGGDLTPTVRIETKLVDRPGLQFTYRVKLDLPSVREASADLADALHGIRNTWIHHLAECFRYVPACDESCAGCTPRPLSISIEGAG